MLLVSNGNVTLVHCTGSKVETHSFFSLSSLQKRNIRKMSRITFAQRRSRVLVGKEGLVLLSVIVNFTERVILCAGFQQGHVSIEFHLDK